MDLKKEMTGLQYWLSMVATFRHQTKVNRIENIYSDTKITPPIGTIFSDAIREMTPGFLRFQQDLQDLMSRSQYPEVILQTQKQKFSSYIEWYKTWYSEHQKEVALFDKINPYNLIYDIIIQTEKEFLQYETIKKGVPDKYFAWYHKILIAIGKEPNITAGSKKDIIALGTNKYHAKSGFYQAFIDFDLTKKQSFVNSLSKRDRSKWKGSITELSNNDSEVINFLKSYPN